MANIEIKKSRLAFVYFAILAAFLIIILRMFHIVIFNDKVTLKDIYSPSKSSARANIYDRNGVLLATDLKTKSLYVSSVLAKNTKAISRGLSKIFPDLSYNEVFKKISHRKNSKRWILIRRNLTPLQVSKVQNLQMAGLLFEDDLIRAYPQKNIASHFVGYVDLDRKGLSGIERQYNEHLESGKDLKLTLDIGIQDILNDELTKTKKEFKAQAAAGLIMDVTNGEILALSSLPNFDLNAQSNANSLQRFNRVINGTYELGSVLKTFTNAAAFEHNLIKRNDIYDVSEPIKYGRFTIEDDHHKKDKITVEEIFAYSSNIGTVKIAQKLGIEKQKEFLDRLGLLKKLEIDFPGLGRPIFPKKWREINLYTISYGHGIAITPLHLASAIAAIVNGGTYYKPIFVKSSKKIEGKRIIKEKTSKIMRDMMRNVVLQGTGKNADIIGYEVGGKTGTAERAESGGYNERKTMASFVATFPTSKPKYLIYVLFDRPDYKFNTGGIIAAPVAGNIIKDIAPLLGIIPKIKNLE